MTLLGKISQPRDTQRLSGWGISSAVGRVSSRLQSKFDRNNRIKIVNSCDYFGKELVPGERLVAFCPSYHRWGAQNSAATYRENLDEEGLPVWSEERSWF